MNFLDTFDITRSTTPNPTAAEQPSLHEEVNQVIGQFGRFWGGFRKQSQTVLEHARKDFGGVVIQAQKEFSKITSNEAPRETNANEDEKGDPSVSGPSNETSEEASNSAASSSTSPAAAGTLFSRLQSALPPNIVQTVQNNIPESLKHASDNIDFAQMRSNLLTELQRVQGITLAQAEEYAHKSEALLRDAVKEAGEVLRDAVKVLPPDQADTTGSNLLWDGTDMWMLPNETNEPQGVGKEREGSSARGLDTHSAVASRAEALLRRLKQDPSIIRHDPEAEEDVKEQYIAWKMKAVDPLDGGIEGAEWNSRIENALEGDNQSLKQLESTLVPSEMTKSSFWLRFFFRSHQIRSEEEKRKALIHSTASTDDDFSWEDEEDETSPTDTKPPQINPSISAGKKTQNQRLSPPSTGLDIGDAPSRRVSSEDSFDLVSSANASVAGDEKVAKPKEDSEDGDSDWE